MPGADPNSSEIGDPRPARRVTAAQASARGDGPAGDAARTSSRRPGDLQLPTLAPFAPVGIFQADAAGNVVYANQAWLDISGLTLDESLGQGWTRCVHPEDLAELQQRWQQSVQRPDSFASAFRLLRRSGELRQIRSQVHPMPLPQNGEACFVACVEDVTHRREFESQLASAVMTDQLTGLSSRVYLLDKVREALTRSDEFALMFLDFDHFKTVNDSWGHDVGDELLRQIADRIRSEIDALQDSSRRPIRCAAARFGGDEFVLLFRGVDGLNDSIRIAEQLHARLAQPYQLGAYRTYNSASIGIVVGPADYERAEDVLRDADTAMYEAKRAGRDRYAVFDTEMHTKVRRRTQIKNEMRSVTHSNELSISYQPIVSLQTGEITAIEALMRWKHPELGWVTPNEFIPIAQESDLILDLGEWVLREGCRQLAAWKDGLGQFAPRQISINLARKQFGDPRMLSTISEVLDQTGLTPHELQLEVTEDAFALDIKEAVDTMRAIRDLGVKLAIDDFGSGTSSFIALHRFPVDVLKIDRSLIREIEVCSGEAAMLHGLVVMARNLDIKLVAEGIETAEQARAVQELGCDYMQGYYFAQPMTSAEIDKFMLETPRLEWFQTGAQAFSQAWSQRLEYHLDPVVEPDRAPTGIW